MGFKFKDGFNKFADLNNKLNEEANKALGKDIFKPINKIETPKEFPALSSYPAYSVAEPEQWTPISGEEQKFIIENAEIVFSKDLDSCFKYKKLFETTAAYYLDRFKSRYQQCINDFDSFVHYFQEIYLEGLISIGHRAYSLLLPFGLFNVTVEKFTSTHLDNYHRALTSYEIMVGIEEKRNQTAREAGNLVGNSIQMQGGGFGVKGAAKGVAQAEVFNLGMGLLGKFVENQSKMTPEQKAEVFAKLKTDLLFEEVYSDYCNTFLTMVKMLADNNILSGVETVITDEYKTMISNLQNPMFPQDKFAQAMAGLIAKYPFEKTSYMLLKAKYPDDANVQKLLNYSSFNE